MRILATGSRAWPEDDKSFRFIADALIYESGGGPVTLIHGAARGADSIAASVAVHAGWKIEQFRAN